MKRNPVMVLAGEFRCGGTERGLADGFRALGWRVQEIDRRDFGLGPGRSLPLRAASRLTRPLAEADYRDGLLDICRALKPDVFLTIKGVGIGADLLGVLRQSGIRTVMYYPDFSFAHPGVRPDSFGAYELFVTTKTFQIAHLERRLGAARTAHVPHGYVDAVHRPVADTIGEQDHRIDLLYAGSHSSFKQRWLEQALAILTEPSVAIVGRRWQDRAAAGPLSRCRMPGERTGIAYAAAIQTARVNIALHCGPADSGWQDLVSTRTFEIPACRGFMLHIDNAEIRAFFEPGVEIDVFSTPDELADKARFYLARPELRATMIERAYARAVPAYGYAARAAAVQVLLRERLPLPAGSG